MEDMMKSKHLVILGMIGVLVFWSDVVVGQCADMKGLIKQCGLYVVKSGPPMNPSRKCCEEIKNADVECVCKNLSNQMLHLIDMQKLHHVADSCGRPITKCGDEDEVEVADGPKTDDINWPPQFMESEDPPKTDDRTPPEFMESEVPPKKQSTRRLSPIVPAKSNLKSSPKFMETADPPSDTD
ncbi:hypothetical protein LR48_Vigan05g013300 [Vigna angularis]|uniref:Bifunctional inhibitor/plant lipid transfer protein/seed storage helical domain-containing protein n=2 Tax=Phaseolus angularis TaxID=3914 RepID=A0A0L9UJ01_PHAAN|nr:uncharacterized protein LOC128194703 [Vigna angularis]KAG2372586.1 uncharacterized protein HKW66_Vig0205450 [Vigna angularis]KOM42529.1 hypothetical protein LR48_Vigan05g013300 [Vigna angularis]BAT93455.1 hypothetical protein VIGAN_07242100 [Vigna angularis var. angularis]